MTNYITETYQTKRDILNSCDKISYDTFKPTRKSIQDIVYGILSSKSFLLSDISRRLKKRY